MPTRRRIAILATTCLAAGLALPSTADATSPTTPDRVAVPAAVPAGAAQLPAAAGGQTVTFTVQLPLRDPAGAEALATAVSTPGNAAYGKYLTPAQFDRRFAPTDQQVATVAGALHDAGISVLSVPANHRYVQARGSVAAVNGLLDVQLRSDAAVSGHPLVADRTPTVPRSLASDVLTVTGLDGVAAVSGARTPDGAPGTAVRATPKAAATRHTVATPCSSFWNQHQATLPTAYQRDGFPTSMCGYNPDQLLSAYGMQGAVAQGTTGKGVTVAIVDSYALPTMPADANAQAVADGNRPFASGQYRQILPNQFDEQDECDAPSWNSEQALDVETVHGIAPDAKVLYVAGADCDYQGLLDPLNTIVDGHLANIVSNSWGFFGEGTNPTSEIAATHAILVQAAAEGIGMYFCTLDNGDEVAMTGSAQAVYPASDPFVTAVGGTTLAVGADGTRALEVGWGSSRAGVTYDTAGNPTGYSPAPPGTFYMGGGGGTSAVFDQPAYQRGVVPTDLAHQYGSQAMRVEPDIAADADPYTGYLIGWTVDGQYQTEAYGGTSLATPIVASLVALASQGRAKPVGFANPLLYRSRRKSIQDIVPTRAPVAMAFTSPLTTSLCYQSCLVTTDRDTSLSTRPGFDPVTGLGVPAGTAFLTTLHKGH